MNVLQKKMAEVMRETARKALKKLDPKSPLAKELHSVDVEAILKQDVERICEALSLFDISRALTLVAQFGVSSPDKRELLKRELKKIAEVSVEKAEAKGVKFDAPVHLRQLLFEL